MTEAGYRRPDLDLLGPHHVRRYRETDGAVGYLWNGATTLLLTTIGRRTGLPRTTPLIFARHGADLVVVASKGGAPQHPLWYHNLVAEPLADVQIEAEHIPVRARTAEGVERDEFWSVAAAQWPNYNAYLARTDRVIPVVVLTPL
jgi:deazaflavin-dependent oxidoreductase (nitroreductase family)